MLTTCVLLLALALGPSMAAQEPGAAPVLEVNQAIARAVKYLKSTQAADGTFPGHAAQHPGGMTALVAYTLAKSGVSRKDYALVAALRALAGAEMKSTYSAAVHLLLCEAVGPSVPRADAQKSLDFLVRTQTSRGVWAYPWSHDCNSNTQFALLGLRAARRLGLELPSATLEAAAEGLWLFQERTGGFRYEEGGRMYDGMTAAALSGLAVLEELGAGASRVRAAIKKHASERAAAEAWLAAHFDIRQNRFASGAWTPFWHYAYMWAIERWCGLTGRARVAGVDWYAEGAAWLVATQAPDGSWTSDDKAMENTCLALLFLRRATVSGGEELDTLYAEIEARAERRALFDQRPPSASVRLLDWWLAGPWQGRDDQRVLLELPFDPKRVQPKQGAKLAKHAWERVALKADGWTNLDELSSNDGDNRLWALASTLSWSPEDGSSPCEAVLWLELEDGWDVYLDGERVGFERRVGSAINGDVHVPLQLAPGAHTLLVLLSDDGGAAAFGALLSGAGSDPPPAGLRVAPAGERDKR